MPKLMAVVATLAAAFTVAVGTATAAPPNMNEDGGGGCHPGSTWEVDVSGGNWIYRCRYGCLAPTWIEVLDCWLV